MKKYVMKMSLTALGLSLVLVACEKEPDSTEPPPPRMVRTLEISEPGDNFWREFPGEVDAAQKAELSFRVSGNLKKMPAKEGDSVKKGQLLAQLDDTDYKIQLKSRQAEYDQAASDFKRAQKLVKDGLLSQADYDKVKAAAESARSNLDAAKKNLEYTSLRAPFAGRVARRYVQNFEEVSAKQPVFLLQDLSSMTIKVDIPESLMIRVKHGAQPDVNAIFEEIPEKEFPLSIKEVASEPDENTNTYEVTLSMERVDGFNILPGMSVTVRGKPPKDSKAVENHITVPAHAVLEDAEGRYVYIVSNTTDGKGTVEKRLVQTGELTSQGLAITTGLEVGDRVVTAGMSKMHSGLEVRLQSGKAN